MNQANLNAIRNRILRGILTLLLCWAGMALIVMILPKEKVDSTFPKNNPLYQIKIDESVVHPILGVRAGHGLECRPLDKSIYKKLSTYRGEDEATSHLAADLREAYFTKSETQAAEQFCGIVHEMKKEEVEELAGRPAFRGGTVSCWKAAEPFSDTWIYIFGIQQRGVRLFFRNDTCFKAEQINSEELFDYAEWRAEEIEHSVVGKTINEIVKLEGPPTIVHGKDRKPVSLSAANNDLSLHYHTGPSSGVEITIVHGICTHTERYLIVH